MTCRILSVALALMLAPPAIAAPVPLPAAGSAEEKALPADARAELAAWRSVTPARGVVDLPEAQVRFRLPANLVFFDGTEANQILQQIWGNPPDTDIKGLIMPAGLSPFDAESWAVSVYFEPTGFIQDEDAKTLDYAELLADMKQGTLDNNTARAEQGFPAIELVGWARPPFYDAAAKKLHWAKLLKFANAPEETLNYDIRVLGRKGVLVMTFIAGASQLPDIERAVPPILAMTEFQPGARYADFDPDLDEVAAVGIGGLIAGKVAAKAGLLAVVLAFAKKFAVLGIALAAGGIAWARKRFARKEADTVA